MDSCLQPDTGVMSEGTSQDYHRMSQALAWLTEHYTQQPTLSQSAQAVGLSAFHFQRLFSRWVGITPKKYVQYLTLQDAKHSLSQSRSVLEAAFDAGLSGPSRLHDLFVTIESMTPGEYKSGGASIKLAFSFQDTPYGECCVTWCERGICAVAFTDNQQDATRHRLQNELPNAQWSSKPSTAPFTISDFLDPTQGKKNPLKLLVGGSAFEMKVWEALLRIPYARIVSYADIARHIGKPSAARAVGSAIGANRIAGLIPCHRVIRSSGVITGYRWGSDRKLAMLTREALRGGTLSPNDSVPGT